MLDCGYQNFTLFIKCIIFIPVHTITVNKDNPVEALDEVEVRSRVSRPIVGVHIQDVTGSNGDNVLFTIDPAPHEARVKRAEAALASAQARQDLAATTLSRTQQLINSNAV